MVSSSAGVMILSGRAAGYQFSRMQGDDLVAEARRHVDVMEYDDDAEIAFTGKLLDERQNFDLMGDIERRSRLIEQQAFGILRNQHRDPDPLALAAGQCIDQPVRKRLDMGQRHGFRDLVAVGVAKSAERAMPGIAAQRDQLLHQHAGGGRRLLRQIGNLAGVFPIAPFA